MIIYTCDWKDCSFNTHVTLWVCCHRIFHSHFSVLVVNSRAYLMNNLLKIFHSIFWMAKTAHCVLSIRRFVSQIIYITMQLISLFYRFICSCIITFLWWIILSSESYCMAYAYFKKNVMTKYKANPILI